MKERDLILLAKDFIHKIGGVAIKYFGSSPYSEKGVPDLIIVLKNCPPIFCEMKRPNGKLTALQIYQLKRLNLAGAYAFHCDNIATFKEQIMAVQHLTLST